MPEFEISCTTSPATGGGSSSSQHSAPTRHPPYTLINILLSEMHASARFASKDPQLRAKFGAVSSWLLCVACCSGYEDVHDAVVELAEVIARVLLLSIIFIFAHCSLGKGTRSNNKFNLSHLQLKPPPPLLSPRLCADVQPRRCRRRLLRAVATGHTVRCTPCHLDARSAPCHVGAAVGGFPYRRDQRRRLCDGPGCCRRRVWVFVQRRHGVHLRDRSGSRGHLRRQFCRP